VADGYPQHVFALPEGATEVILVRHGASAHALPGIPFPLVDGHGDPALAPEGKRQAEALVERLATEPIAAIFVTTLRRTQETAAPFAARLGLEPVVVGELREVNLGDLEGGEWRIRVANGDPLVARVVAEQRWDVVPNAEPAAEFAARVRAGVEKIVETTGPNAVAAAVVHGGVIGELARQASGSRPFAFVHADNASLTRLVVLPDGDWLLRSFNDTAHLANHA
jgi:2,3-bisphosphoglycerate-dependent phosphoglycerate mutase